METKELPEITTEERLPWHKPEIQRLMVNLDTRDLTGSGTDGTTGSTSPLV